MDSKKKYRYNYRLRLFLPITILIWVTIAVMATYSFQREAQYRLQTVKSDIQPTISPTKEFLLCQTSMNTH